MQPQGIGPGGRLSIQQLAELGGKLFQAYAIGQFILLVGIAPIYCARLHRRRSRAARA